MYKIPKSMLQSNYRKFAWRAAEKFLRDLEQVCDISEAYVFCSFTAGKRRPADVDLIVFVKLGDKRYGTSWSVDLTFVPDNQHGTAVLQDTDKWMRQKYGKHNYEIVRIK